MARPIITVVALAIVVGVCVLYVHAPATLPEELIRQAIENIKE